MPEYTSLETTLRAIGYARPKSIQEAVAILSKLGPTARILAGGTDLIPQVTEYVRDADVLVDAKHIPELIEMEFQSEGSLMLGASVPCSRIYEDPRVARAFPGLVDAARIVGSTAIQGRASVGGNLCNSGPAADTIPPLIVYSAIARIAGPQGYREVAVEDFCTAPGRNVLERGEMLVSLHLPAPPARSGANYLRFIPRNEMDIAVAGAAAFVALNESGLVSACRIALSAVAPTPLYVPAAGAALVNREPTEDAIAESARIAQSACSAIDDMRGTAKHRRHLIGILTKRSLRRAVERARGEKESEA